MFCLTSCSTTTKITVYGESGTKIWTPSFRELACIDSSGKVDITIPDDNYYAFLLSFKPGTSNVIPFALDYKNKYYLGARVAKVVGMGLGGFGSILELSGIVAVALAPETFPGFFFSGLGLSAAGLSLGIPGDFRSKQTNHEYSYQYLPAQKTNQDMIMTKPQLDTVKSERVIEEKTPSMASSNSGTSASSSSSKKMASSNSTKTLSSSSSTKTFKDNAVKIEGTYVGTGVLKQGNETIESYSGIKVVIKKKTAEVVLVNVIESDGSKFFYSDGEYRIKKQPNGKYVLTLKEISTATIEIDANNNMVYLHPRVNIDGSIYKLSIKAKKSTL